MRRTVRKVSADLSRLYLEEEDEIQKEWATNGWWTYLTPPVFGERPESEEKQNLERERIQRLAAIKIKESSLRQEEAKARGQESLLQELHARIDAKEKPSESQRRADEQRRQRRLWEEQEAKRRDEEQKRREREEALAKQQHEAAQRARETMMREARERAAQEVDETRRRKERVEREANEAAERLRAMRAATEQRCQQEQRRQAEERRQAE